MNKIKNTLKHIADNRTVIIRNTFVAAAAVSGVILASSFFVGDKELEAAIDTPDVDTEA